MAYVHYVSVCRTLVLVSHGTLRYRCTSEAQCPYARSLSVNLSRFHPVFFLHYFPSHWMRSSNLCWWRSYCLDSVTAQAIIPQLTYDSVSNTHQMPRVVWSAKCPCRSIACLVYNVLSPSGRSFCFPAHTTHVTPVEHSATLSTRWVYTLISCSVRLISILLLLKPGYLFTVVAPARRCPGSLFNILP